MDGQPPPDDQTPTDPGHAESQTPEGSRGQAEAPGAAEPDATVAPQAPAPPEAPTAPAPGPGPSAAEPSAAAGANGTGANVPKVPQSTPAAAGSTPPAHGGYAGLQAAASKMTARGPRKPSAEGKAAAPASGSTAAPAPRAAAPAPATGTETRVGRVVSVSGSQVVVLLDQAKIADQEARGLEIGKIVKMRSERGLAFGLVGGLSIPVPAQALGEPEMRIVEIELLGESRVDSAGRYSRFQRGVTSFPALGDSVFAATQQDLGIVFANGGGDRVKVGTIHQDRSLPACVAVDDLLGKHFAMLGTTGSGKSCAVALILRSILEDHRNAHVVLLDPHNEYPRAFGELAELIDPDSLELPFWLFNFEEFVEVVLGRKGSPDAIEASILNELIPVAKRQFLGDVEDNRYVTADTPVPYRFNYLIQLIDEIIGKLEKPEDLGPYMRLKARLKSLQADSRFSFMFGSVALRDNMSHIISRLFRIPVDGRPITIIDLSGVPSEILNVVVSVLCRMTFDFAIWSDRALPVLFVCEEAHRYAPRNSDLGFEPTKRALSRIAKEGRKYGVSLCVITQRPSELDTDILSQCNTIFALRMSNNKDQDFVRGTLSESAEGLMYFLPLLRTAEAIAVGEGVPVPVRICFDELPEEFRPLSGTAPFSTTWKVDRGDMKFIDAVVDRWRRQQR